MDLPTMLTPIESATREIRSLDGLWNFARDIDDGGESRGWHSSPLPDALRMPVPSSYNDITQDVELRDHVGAVWYQRSVWIPKDWNADDIELRIGGGGNHTTVYWDSVKTGTHRGAFLPLSLVFGDNINRDNSC